MKRRSLKFTVILLALSCSETEFDAELKEKQTASNDATIGVEASGLPPTADDSPNGSNGNKQTDTFNPTKDKGLLDLLLVIDDSRSMENVHTHLKNGLDSLLTHIDNSNWQIKIVDTDPSDMCEHTIISKANKGDYTTRLDDFASSSGAKQERTLQKARAALKLSDNCPAWLRTGSTLAAVIITDENHQCDNPSATDNRGDGNSFQCHGQDSVSNFIAELEGLREREDQTKLYGIFDTEETCRDTREVYTEHHLSCFDHSATNRDNDKCKRTNPCYNRGNRYKWHSASYLAEESEFDDILHLHEDESKYDEFLKKISSGIKEVLQDQFTLTKEPDTAKGITVTVDGNSNTGFTISGKILTFTPSLPDGAKEITVTYVPKSP